MVDLLETTLRDGSYAVDFRFTARDASLIASALEQAGVEWIEIGHGLGLHAREAGKGDAAASDAEYLEAVGSVLKKAKYGMFCIPGIARLEDIDMAADLGLKFLRIGTNIAELKGQQRYFERAKKRGLFVSANLMKSYTVPPAEFARYARMAKDYGADVAVVVDSAGGMLPGDVEEYFRASRDTCDIPLGFHGHNNLGMANANTLAAIKSGALIVDTSLKGIGRSAGNAVTEMIVVMLKKLGHEVGINEYAVMDIGEKYISSIMHNLKNTPLSIVSGYAQFHSSFLGTIMRFSEKYCIDPRELIVRVTEKDKVNAPEQLVEELSREIKREKDRSTSRMISPVVFSRFRKAEKDKDPEVQIKILMDEIVSESKKKGKKSAVNIVLSEGNGNFLSQFIQESPLFITGSMEISGYEYARPLIRHIDGKADYILLDGSLKKESDRETLRSVISGFQGSAVLLYNDLLAWSKSVVSLVCHMAKGMADRIIIIHGMSAVSRHIARQAADLGARVAIFDPWTRAYVLSEGSRLVGEPDFLGHCDVLISCDRERRMTEDFVKGFKKIDAVIDSKIDSLEKEAVLHLHERGIRLVRPDMRSVIAGEILHQAGMHELVRRDMGRMTVEGQSVISGGLIGREGEIIVDSLSHPTQIIGVARGTGEVNYDVEESRRESIQAVQNYIDSRIEKYEE
jgi:4-hydroxy-2-oxovalerate aldolase